MPQKIYQYANGWEMPLSAIKIPKSFLETHPSSDKIIAVEQFYAKHGVLDQPILINNNGYLFDGYVRYLVAKGLGLETVPVIQIKAKIRGEAPRVPVTIFLSLKERLLGKATVLI